MTKYIAIDGRGGSGKTYLSIALGKALSVPVLHLDDYGNDFEPFVGIPAFIDAIKKTEGEIVIFEGVGAFDDRLDKFNAFKILAEPPDNVRISRLAKRDVPRVDRSVSDWNRIGEIWAKAEKKYFDKHQRDKANIIVDSLNTSSDINTIVQAFQSNNTIWGLSAKGN